MESIPSEPELWSRAGQHQHDNHHLDNAEPHDADNNHAYAELNNRDALFH